MRGTLQNPLSPFAHRATANATLIHEG